MKNLNWLLLVFFYSSIFGQNNKIIKLDKIDSLLTNSIANFIIDKKETYPIFDSIGYIQIRQTFLDKEAAKNKLKFKYDITDQYYRPTNDLPNFYTYIENKLVLIYNNSLIFNSYLNNKKQRKINRLLKPYLNKTIHLKIKDKSGRLIVDHKHFRDESITIHGGITFSIYENGKVTVN